MPIFENLELTLFLIFSSAATSFMTAAMGIGGGVMLLAILASTLPPIALIPVHGTTLISMFVGATGPLVAGFVHRQNYDKLEATSTFATCMSLQHCLKMIVFTLIGFSFWQWLPLILLMVLGGMLGTWLGLKMLNKIPQKLFSQVFRLVITLMAARLLWQASTSLI